MTLAAVAVALPACESGCDPGTVNQASAFLDAHQSCEADEDCVTVRDFCGELPGGFCGQLGMNRQGAESAQWMALERELRDCAPDKCTVCDALLVPTCSNGSCSGS
jgi:hypothetical protein